MKKITTTIIICLLMSNNTLIAQDDQGKNIGNTIKTAIETALPVWGTISNMIWPDGKANDRIKKSELEDKIRVAETKIKEETMANFQTKIRPISRLVEELKLINKITEPAIIAEKYLIELEFELNKQTINWSNVKTKKNTAMTFLGKIAQIPHNEIDKTISDIFLAFKIKELSTSKTTVGNDLNSFLEQKDKDNSIVKTKELLNYVSPAARVSSTYVVKLLNDISALQNWANGAMGDSVKSYKESDSYKSLGEE